MLTLVLKWIFVTSPNNAAVCLRYGVYGVDEEKYGYTALHHVKVGDLVFLYITSCGVFIGPWRVASYPCRNPEHPAVKEWITRSKRCEVYSIIVGLESYGNMVLTPGEAVLRELLFVTNKKGLETGDVKGGWTDHFQFSIISIRDEDYEILVNYGKPVCQVCTDLNIEANYVRLYKKLVDCDFNKVCNVICRNT